MDKLLMETEPRTIMLLLVSVSLLVMAALGSYVIWPEYRDFRKSMTTLSVLRDVTSRGDNLAQEMSVLKTSVERLDHELHGDMVNTPENEMESFIIGRLQTISWSNNIELLRVTPGNGSSVRIFEEVLFEVMIAGDYFDIYNWLQSLDDELGFVVVKHFDLRPVVGSNEDGRLNARFTIVSYREASDA